MSDFEHELLDILDQDTKFDPARAQVLRLQVGDEYKKKKRRLLIRTWVWHAVAAAILIPGLIQVDSSGNELRATQGLVWVILAATLLVVIKLWYWIVHSRLEIMREIKRLELRWTLAQSREQIAEEPSEQ